MDTQPSAWARYDAGQSISRVGRIIEGAGVGLFLALFGFWLAAYALEWPVSTRDVADGLMWVNEGMLGLLIGFAAGRRHAVRMLRAATDAVSTDAAAAQGRPGTPR